MLSPIFNAVIFLMTLSLSVSFFYRDGKWAFSNGRKAFRYFTFLSNIFCALAALLLCVFPDAQWAWTLKYMGTNAVTVTMLTVFLFLAPTMGGLGPLLKGPDFVMHLLTPLLALFSFTVLERQRMDFRTAMLGMIPVLLYGILYLYRIRFAPKERRWEDFYGFNKGGKWPVSFAAMGMATFLLCLALMAIQNL